MRAARVYQRNHRGRDLRLSRGGFTPGGREIKMSVPHCQQCSWHKYAERKPQSLLARLWRWHTRWCPGWKAYQKWLAEQPPSSTSAADRPRTPN